MNGKAPSTPPVVIGGGARSFQADAPPARILMVDDHPPNLMALAAILEPLAQELVHAHSGEESLRYLLESDRSEEHTSELQSQFHLVCRLLLEKKNKSHS